VPSRVRLKATLPLLVAPDVVKPIVGRARITGDWKVIFPPLPAVDEALISPRIVVLFAPEFKAIFPPVPAPDEREFRV